jgi:uncharacterized protein YkwD
LARRGVIGILVAVRIPSTRLGALLALAAFCAVALTPLARPAEAQAAGCAFGSAWGTKRPALATQVVKLVNDYRSKRGLSRVSQMPELTRAAMWKSGHMARYDYFDHNDAGSANRSPGQRLSACGYRGQTWGENIAYGYPTAGDVMRGWINSPGHRANLDNPRFNAIGVGAVQKAGGRTIYWTQIFGVTSRPGRLRSELRVSRRSSLRPRQRQTVKFDMGSARRGRLIVKVLNRRGKRPVAVRLHCNGRRVGRASGRRGKAAIVNRRIPRGRCAAMIESGPQSVGYRVTLALR